MRGVRRLNRSEFEHVAHRAGGGLGMLRESSIGFGGGRLTDGCDAQLANSSNQRRQPELDERP